MQGVVVERVIPLTTFLGISFGIVAYTEFDLGLYFIVFTLVLLLCSGMFVYALRAEKHLRFLLIVLTVFVVSVIFGLTRSSQSEQEFRLGAYAGQSVTVQGKIVKEPEKRESYLLLVVNANSIKTKTKCEIVNERILVRSDLHENVSYGDSVVVTGLLDVPEPFSTENDRVFFYDNYLAKDGVGAIVSFASIESVQPNETKNLYNFLYRLKKSYLDSIARYIPDPEASLLGGLTVGTKQSLGDELEKDFRATGIIHIVVLSGYNVVIIAETIIRSLRVLSVRRRLVVSVFAVTLFVILVGAGATVVRAAIMAIAALFVRSTGHTAVGVQLLFLAAIIMVTINPLLLLYDPSFQLSFIATLGLILFSKPIEGFLSWIRPRAFREIATATIATQIAVLPFLIYLIGEASLVALPVNLLILPTVPLAMLLGFITGTLGVIQFVSVFLAPLFGVLAFFVLSYQLLIVDTFARIPFATTTLPPLSLSHVILLYTLMGFLVWSFHNKDSTEQTA
ncbi:MAG: ComEC/Rec2 family competence protein [Candidatus Paceibacterota bacterium]